MKIYTRTGDEGETGLYGGQRVRKDDLRVEAYGAVDEANAALGLAITGLRNSELRTLATRLQSDLFTVGADLAAPLSRDEQAGHAIVPRITSRHVADIEAEIDLVEATLEPLKNFILPGGTLGAAGLHVARAALRRAERRTVALLRACPDDVNPESLRYLNRVADLLFVLARAANRRDGTHDVVWTRHD
jgi:cob(I)alamin adenosyltransferase